MLKKFALPVAILYSVTLAVFSLINPKDIVDVELSISDKLIHFLAYATLTVFWYNVFSNKFYPNKTKAIIYAAIFSILFGIIIEVLQGSITTVRQSDFNDVIANIFGVLTASVVMLINTKKQVKN